MATINVDQTYVDLLLPRHANGDPKQPMRCGGHTYLLQENIETSACAFACVSAGAVIDGNGFTLTTHTGRYQGSTVIEYPIIANGDFEAGGLGSWNLVSGSASVVANGRKFGTTPYMMGDYALSIQPGDSCVLRTAGSYATTSGVVYEALCDTAQNNIPFTIRIIDAATLLTINSVEAPKQAPLVGFTSTGQSVFIELEYNNTGQFSGYADNVKLLPWVGPSILSGERWVPAESQESHIPRIISEQNSVFGSENTIIRNLTILQENVAFRADGINAYGSQATSSTDPATTTAVRIEDCDITCNGDDASAYYGFRAEGCNIHRNTFRMNGETQWVRNRQLHNPCMRFDQSFGHYLSVSGNTLTRCPHTGIYIGNCTRWDINDNKIYMNSRHTDGYGVYANETLCSESTPGRIRSNLIDAYTGTHGADSGRGILTDGLSGKPMGNIIIEDNTIIVTELGNSEFTTAGLEVTGYRLRCYSNGTLSNVTFRNNDVTAVTYDNNVHTAWGTAISGLKVDVPGCVIQGNHFKAFWIGSGSSEDNIAGAAAVLDWRDTTNTLPLIDNIFESNCVAVNFVGRDSGVSQKSNVSFESNEYRLRTSDETIPGSGTAGAIARAHYIGLQASVNQMTGVIEDINLGSGLYTGYPEYDMQFDPSCPTGHEFGFGHIVTLTIHSASDVPVDNASVVCTDDEGTAHTVVTESDGIAAFNLPKFIRRQTATGNNSSDTVVNPYTVTVTASGQTFLPLTETFDDTHGDYSPVTRDIAFVVRAEGAGPSASPSASVSSSVSSSPSSSPSSSSSIGATSSPSASVSASVSASPSASPSASISASATSSPSASVSASPSASPSGSSSVATSPSASPSASISASATSSPSASLSASTTASPSASVSASPSSSVSASPSISISPTPSASLSASPSASSSVSSSPSASPSFSPEFRPEFKFVLDPGEVMTSNFLSKTPNERIAVSVDFTKAIGASDGVSAIVSFDDDNVLSDSSDAYISGNIVNWVIYGGTESNSVGRVALRVRLASGELLEVDCMIVVATPEIN